MIDELPNRILIVRPSAMGDIVMASSLISGLKHFYPTVSIDWLIEPRFGGLLEGHPGVHRLIFWDKRDWRNKLKGLRLGAVAKELRGLWRGLRFGPSSGQEGKPFYDIVVDAQGLFRSRFLSWLTGAPHRIGLSSREPGAFFMTEIVTPPSNKFMGSEYLFLLSHITGADIGLLKEVARPIIHVPPKHIAEAAEVLKGYGIGRYAVFLPFTTRAQKHWLKERWMELAEAIKVLGYTAIVLGGPMDREEAMAISSGSKNVLSLAGEVSLATAIAIIQGAALAVGVDTGLTHIAVVSNIPTIALFGSTCPYLSSWNPRLRVIYHGLPCAPCKRSPVCKDGFKCMEDISVSEVFANIESVLNDKAQL